MRGTALVPLQSTKEIHKIGKEMKNMNQTQTRSLRKKVLSLILAVVMAVSLLPISAFASGNSKASTTASTDEFVRIFHLDCGRKYFSVKQIEELIDAASDANYTHVELAIGNDGLRFLLDNMAVGTYTSENVTAGIQQGNKNYYNAGDKNELTQSEMDEIINHAKSKNISIIPPAQQPRPHGRYYRLHGNARDEQCGVFCKLVWYLCAHH